MLGELIEVNGKLWTKDITDIAYGESSIYSIEDAKKIADKYKESGYRVPNYEDWSRLIKSGENFGLDPYWVYVLIPESTSSAFHLNGISSTLWMKIMRSVNSAWFVMPGN